MKCPGIAPKFVSIVLGISLLLSGCSFQNRDSNSSNAEFSTKKSLDQTLESDDFKLTPVKKVMLIKPTEVLTFSCEFILAKPTEVTPNCADFGIAITDIDWKVWSATGAKGTGVYLANDCKPNCVEGKILQSPVSINLDVLFTDGQRYFLRYLTFTGSDKLPQAKKITGTWDLAEFYITF
jgi:hypothetical protein